MWTSHRKSEDILTSYYLRADVIYCSYCDLSAAVQYSCDQSLLEHILIA